MGASRALGAVLVAACIVVAALHLYFGYIEGSWGAGALAFALPITVGLLVVCGLGGWLGWIMASTKEVAPTPAVSSSSSEEPVTEAEKKPSKKK
jgi:hypothetical protein